MTLNLTLHSLHISVFIVFTLFINFCFIFFFLFLCMDPSKGKIFWKYIHSNFLRVHIMEKTFSINFIQLRNSDGGKKRTDWSVLRTS